MYNRPHMMQFVKYYDVTAESLCKLRPANVEFLDKKKQICATSGY